MERHRATYPCGTPRPPLAPTRRQFVQGMLVGAAAAGCAGKTAMMSLPDAATPDGPRLGKTATDRVVLGNTGIEVSRLAMGSGTHGSGGSSDQTRLGVAGFAGVLTHGFDQGIRFFETADAYGAHPHIAEAIRQVGRQNVVVLTKTAAQTAAGAQADLDRFRRELGIDMIDIVLLHNKQSATWTTECAGAMDVLSAAKDSGVIRAHGVSCHTLSALQLAARDAVGRHRPRAHQPRRHPDGLRPGDGDQPAQADEGRRQGRHRHEDPRRGPAQQRRRPRHHPRGALDTIDAFTIGFTSNTQLDQVMQKIAAV